MQQSNELDKISTFLEKGIEPCLVVPDKYRPVSNHDKGSDRVVYFMPGKNAVVKFSLRPLDSVNQTKREAEFYNKIKNNTEISKYFAKVYDYNSTKYLIQEYINTDKTITDKDIDNWISDVEKFGISINDARKDNFGYRGEQLVMLDYAGCYLS